jgi:phosphoenolpyruvate-protein kinase (PTS system EI component)
LSTGSEQPREAEQTLEGKSIALNSGRTGVCLQRRKRRRRRRKRRRRRRRRRKEEEEEKKKKKKNNTKTYGVIRVGKNLLLTNKMEAGGINMMNLDNVGLWQMILLG